MRFCSDSAGRGVLAWIAVLLACALIARVGQAQAPSPGVFSTFQADLVPDIGSVLEPATMRSRVVGVDSQQLTAARLGQETLRLNLFDDVAVAVRIDRVRPTRSGYYITGRPQGFEWGEVRLVVNGPVTVGTVVTPEGKYTIRYGGAGRHIVRQVDPSAELLEDDVVETPLPAGPPQGIAPGETLPATPLQGVTPGETLPVGPPEPILPGDPLPASPSNAIVPGDPLGAVVRPAKATVEEQPTEDGSEVRVLVVYTPSILRHQGGTAGMDAVIDLMIQSANEAFEVSGINPRLVLAHTALVNYVEERSPIDLLRLETPDDGYMDEIHALRNEYAADLVHLITLRVAGPGGTARVIRNESLSDESTAAFAVTASDSEETFTHETGHNFGLRHDRYRDGLFPPIYPYAYGYQNNLAFEPGTPASSRWSTIMAYADRCANAGFYCPRLMRFSNPDQTYLGDPLGVPADDPATGPEGPADARMAVNRTARWVGSFRSEACTEFAVSPETPVAPVEGGEVIFQVETAPGCLWEASSQTAFLVPVSEARHAGPELVSIDVEPNETGEERIGAVTVAGKSVELRQLATDTGICSRSPAVVRAIAADESCDEVTDEHLSQIAALDLGNQRLAPLKAGDFAGLSSLQSLSLEGSRLTELPTGLFSKLSNLTDLNLRDNELTELPDRLFTGLSSLERLRLDRNRLARLTQGVFSDLVNLQELDLSANELSTLPDGLFTVVTGLRQLNLGQNQLTTLSSQLFDELPQLIVLDLSDNQLFELPENFLDGLTALWTLSLSGNSFTRVPTEVFEDITDLRHLFFCCNHLTNLPDRAFSGLSELRWLQLSDNQIAEIPPGLFAGLSRLSGLWINKNNVTTLPDGLFSGLSLLGTLDLRENQLSSLPEGVFSGLTSLSQLRLGANTVDPLPLGLTLEKVGEDRFKAVAPTGAPFELAIPIGSDGGMIEGDADTVTIPAGASESLPLGVSRVTGSQRRITVDMGMLPEPSNLYAGYVFEKDGALPLLVLPSNDPEDATLHGLWLSQERLDPAFSPETSRYSVSVARSASIATVTLTTSHASATVAFHDENGDALADADANADGHQVRLNQAETVVEVEVTAENGTSTRTYTLVVTREDNHCERTGEVLTAILASLPEVDACGDLRDAHLVNISRLDLSEQGISSLKSGDFASLSALETLLLRYNQLTELPADAFAGLSALKNLWLDSNQLTDLPAGVFSGLSSLEFLYLPGNQLESLPDNVFSGLSALRRLHLGENRLSRLPDGIFSELSRLETLSLGENQIADLPPNVFSDLSSLRDLSLYRNHLTSLPANAFSALSGLHDLELSVNELTNLSPNVFSVLTVLRTLRIHSNNLSSVPANAFSELSKLEHLSLAANAFTSLPADLLSGLTALEVLELESNRLSALPGGLLAGLSNLRVLNLRNNAVQPLPISVSLQSEAGGQVKAIVPTGAPFALELSLSVGGGGRIEGDANTVTVPTGVVESAPLRVTRIDEDADTATVDIASLPTLPSEPGGTHQGYVLTKDPMLPITITLPQDIAPPAQVTGIEVARGGTSLRVSWVLVSGAEGYKVQWKSGDEDYDEESRQAVVSGGDTVSYTITGLTDGTEYTVRVLATREGADDGPFSDEVVATTRSGDPDVNGDGALDGDDAQIMYYAFRFPSLVGDGETGGTEASRQRFLAGYSGLDEPNDEALREMVRKANVWATEGLNEGGDINADGMIDGSDARAMNYAYRYESLLGDGEEGGAARFRLQLLGPLAGKPDPTDEELKTMLRRANELREAYSQ